ncbi:hypothetical protein SB85_00610 [Xanthomonas sacchari]|nr:hypothetical protein SB85_00610 [Xanthomonas sacchari]
MHGNAELECQFVQILQVAYTIDVSKEAWLPIIAPLHDMLSDAWKIQTGTTWHVRSFSLRWDQLHAFEQLFPSGDVQTLCRESAL